MNKITTAYSITKIKVEAYDESVLKEIIHKELIYRLASQLLEDKALPLPLFKNDAYEYRIDVYTLSREEYLEAKKLEMELAAYKKIAGHVQDLVDREIKEQTIMYLTN